MISRIELICIGKELLTGKTLNTNANWLAKRITGLGLDLNRITVVGDDIDAISGAVQCACACYPCFIIITGGLGPTFDDKTLEGLAKALECKLEINEEALGMIKRKYDEYAREGKMEKVELTSPRIKMARLPEGAKPMFNPIGTAPGVLIHHEDITMVALPGVPSEMRSIFDESVAPLLKQVVGDVTFFESSMEATGVMESEIAPIIERVMLENPYVYIKSHPKGAEVIPRIEFHFSTKARKASVAKKRVSKAFVQLSELIQARNGKIRPIKKE